MSAAVIHRTTGSTLPEIDAIDVPSVFPAPLGQAAGGYVLISIKKGHLPAACSRAGNARMAGFSSHR
jgi:hypothetical protein